MSCIADCVSNGRFCIPINFPEFYSRVQSSYLEDVLSFQVVFVSFVRWYYSSVDSRGSFFLTAKAKPFWVLYEMPREF